MMKMPVVYCGEYMVQAMFTKCHQNQELGAVDLRTILHSIYLRDTPVSIISAMK
jgi:hypothetical protein